MEFQVHSQFRDKKKNHGIAGKEDHTRTYTLEQYACENNPIGAR